MTDPTVIVGGGPAGAAAAIRIVEAGLPVTLFERTEAPHDVVCGDFLSNAALQALACLGIDPFALGAVPISQVRLIYGERVAEGRLPFPACSFPRRLLDETLLARASQVGACVRRGAKVRSVLVRDEGVTLEVAGGETLRPHRALLATGKHDLRGAPRPGRRAGAVGLKSYVQLAPGQYADMAGAVELILLPGAYGGLQPVGDGWAVLCLMVRRPDRGRALPHPERLMQWLADHSPHLKRRLAGANAASTRAETVAGVPYGYLHRPRASQAPGLFRIGDQAAVIPSLVGDGIAIALVSAVEAARAIARGEDAVRYHRRLNIAVKAQIRTAMLVHGFALCPRMQSWAVHAVGLWPGLIGFTASRTRCYQPSIVPRSKTVRDWLAFGSRGVPLEKCVVARS